VQRGRTVVNARTIRSALRSPCRKVGIRPIEGALASTRRTLNPRVVWRRLARSLAKNRFGGSRHAWDEKEAHPGQLRATCERQNTQRTGIGSLSRKARRVGDNGATHRRAVRHAWEANVAKNHVVFGVEYGARTTDHFGEAGGSR
jgi:hypothetical protein